MKPLKLALLSAAALLLTAGPALADTATFSLTTVDPVVPDGNTVTFDGAISASSANTGVIYLLGDTFTIDSPLVLDDSDFYSDTPIDLLPGQSYNGRLFTVTVPGSAAEGLYNGSFQVEFADSSFNTFTENSNFQVTATPEPGTWLLLSSGLAAAGIFRRRANRSA